MLQDGSGNGSEDEMYDKESSITAQIGSRSVSFDEVRTPPGLPGSRSVSFDDIPIYYYYKENEPTTSRIHTPDEPLARLPQDQRLGSYNNQRAHLYIPDIDY